MLVVEESTYLEHFGVPGMKWGVRRDYRTQALERAARGEGGAATKIRALSKLGPIDLIRGRGIKGGAGRKAVRFRSREERRAMGEARLRDQIVHYGSTRLSDLIPVSSKNAHKKTTARTDKMLVAGAGALFIANIVAGQMTKKG